MLPNLKLNKIFYDDLLREKKMFQPSSSFAPLPTGCAALTRTPPLQIMPGRPPHGAAPRAASAAPLRRRQWQPEWIEWRRIRRGGGPRCPRPFKFGPALTRIVHAAVAQPLRSRVGRGARGRRPTPHAPRPRAKSAPRSPGAPPGRDSGSPGSGRPGHSAGAAGPLLFRICPGLPYSESVRASPDARSGILEGTSAPSDPQCHRSWPPPG